ncbi:MAG: DUF2268 domain-containing protein [Bacteroidales bacterium]|nr:DUF2268 domain-containing protein [Bacteroidales bacterium]
MPYTKKIVILFLLINVFWCKYSVAQFYSTGQDPASAKWNQINTDNFQIIFQKEFNNQAQNIANILEYYYKKAGKTLEHNPQKISVIVHNQTVTSNGYVAWAPKRMELFVTPPQDGYPDPWLEHLCIHELRHVVQIDKLNQGITKILSIVFGQQATGLVTAQLPMWYLEGDAVCTETALAKFGRGRLPSFERGIKTHLLSDDDRYSFDKMLFGSYRNYVPNYYELGYQLTAYTRNKYEVDIWSRIENHVAKNSYTLLPTYYAFYRGLKKNIGLSQEQLFNETFNYLDSTWTVENTEKKQISPRYFQNYNINDYEDYINPIVINDDNILALKKGLSHIPQFVLVSKDSEKLIYEPGYLVSNDFSYAKGVLVWAEYRPDRRWHNREYTSIKLLNIKTQKEKVIIEKSRYFSPDFSLSAEKIVVVKVNEKNRSSLVILNSFDGSVIKEIKSSKNYFIQRPKWSKDDRYIYIIELTSDGKQVSRYDFDINKWEIVFKIENGDIQRIKPSDNYIYFHSTINGTDNIYVYDENSREIYQISESGFGISEFDISTNKNELITNEYTSQGFRLAKIPIERALWKKIDQVENYKFEFADILSEQESFEKPQTGSQQKEFAVKPYRKALSLFNFHSWIPLYVDYDNMDLGNVFADPSEIYGNIHPGIMLLSQNKLSSTESIVAYAYKNGNHYLTSSLIFKGQYPVVKISANYGDNQLIQTTSDATWYPESNIAYSYDLDIYVPFNLTKGKFIKGFRPLISVEYFDNLYYNYQNNYYIKGIEFVQTELFFYSYQFKAERDIIPKLGAIFDFNLFNTPFDSELFGYMYNADAIFYLPGGKNNGIKINFGYQYQEPDLYLFRSNFDFPRGIEKKRTERMVKLYCDYVFPIAYSDWNLGSFIYIKRFRGDLFVDYAYNTYRTVNEDRTRYIWPIDHNFSFGIELTADYHLLRTIFPLNTGVRVGFAPTEGSLILEMLFGIDLYSF